MGALAIAMAVASMIAGKPVTIACDTDTNPGPGIKPPPGFVVEAWTPVGGRRIHMAPKLCAGLRAPVGSTTFALSLRVVLHESGHAYGNKSESCAESFAHDYARMAVFDFYGIDTWMGFWAERVERQIKAETARRPTEYQPQRGEICFPVR